MTVLSVDFWANVRLLLYPVIAVGGMAWALGFWLRYRTTECAGDRWAGGLGAALVVLGLMGTGALAVSKQTGFTIVTTVMITVGVLAPAVVLMWGTVKLFVGGWRRPAPSRETDG